MGLRWYGDERLKEIRQEMTRRISRAGMTLVQYTLRHMGQQSTRGKGKNMRGLNPSRPGEFPRRVTQHLARNIDWETYTDRIGGRWGTNVKYGAIMERAGGKRRRPWMSLANRALRRRIRSILAGGS